MHRLARVKRGEKVCTVDVGVRLGADALLAGKAQYHLGKFFPHVLLVIDNGHVKHGLLPSPPRRIHKKRRPRGRVRGRRVVPCVLGFGSAGAEWEASAPAWGIACRAITCRP